MPLQPGRHEVTPVARGEVSEDLEREGDEFATLAMDVRELMRKRIRKWLKLPFPYGSEFPWDSTGHEEIHTWLLAERRYAAANKTVGAVLAYMALMPHWAYSGSARRYWDYVINGKT